MGSCSVTWRRLTLGDQDSITGWFKKTFVESTIKMAIIKRDMRQTLTGMGLHQTYTLPGYTNQAVEAGDEIMDADGVYYEVKAFLNHQLADKSVLRECELEIMELHE